MKKMMCAALLSAAFLTAGNSVFAQVQQTGSEKLIIAKVWY